MPRTDLALCARAPAKVNLVLLVGARRPDGYHDLQTLMVPLGLADEIEVRIRRGPSGSVTCRVPGRPDLDGASNLAARAAEAFRRRFGVTDAIDLLIVKRVPVTAGLGGGSSDAAAVLRALSRAYGVRDREALAALALEIGSDVPFFLGSGPAWAAGRGEQLRAARVPPLDLVLLTPRDEALAIRAGDAYAWLDDARGAAAGSLARPLRLHAWSASSVRNDLQGPCFERRPTLRGMAGLLVGQGATAAIMSGSGPTVFGVFRDRAQARRAAEAARRLDVEVHVTRSLLRHPGVSTWKSPRSESSRSPRRSSRHT